jgi:hemerythrin-like metal-binding protein
MPIKWIPALSVNIGAIDEQHQKLITLINDLDAAMAQGKGNDILATILCELTDYTVSHFAYEETLFARHNYPDTFPHMAEHKMFVDQVSRFKKDFEDGKLALSIQIIAFLSEWLRRHIKGTDQRYTAFFNAKGVS